MTASERLHLELPSTHGAPRAARHAVHELLARRSRDVDADDLDLVVSELVANAVLHGDPPIEMTVTADEHRLLVEVCDGSMTQPPVPATGIGRPGGGRGLVIVEKLSDTWGVMRRGRGKCVWAVCRARSDCAPAPDTRRA